MNDKEFPENDDARLNFLWPEESDPFEAPVASRMERPNVDIVVDIVAEIAKERPNFDPYTGKPIEYPLDEARIEESQRFLHRVPELIELPVLNELLPSSTCAGTRFRSTGTS